jgi:hypothetical protein
MSPITASVVSALGSAFIAASVAAFSLVRTLRSNRELLADQRRREDLERADANRYRNHDRRLNAAAQYIAALDHFRHSVVDLDSRSSDSRNKTTTFARAAVEAHALVDLYFPEVVQRRSERSFKRVAEMHRRKLSTGHLEHGMNDRAKAARNQLIAAMKDSIGEPPAGVSSWGLQRADGHSGVTAGPASGGSS